MRTTLTLDDDVVAALQRLQRRSRRPWKQVVNEIIRAGIAAADSREQGHPRVHRTKTVRLGAPKLGDIANVHEVLSVAEGEARR